MRHGLRDTPLSLGFSQAIEAGQANQQVKNASRPVQRVIENRPIFPRRVFPCLMGEAVGVPRQHAKRWALENDLRRLLEKWIDRFRESGPSPGFEEHVGGQEVEGCVRTPVDRDVPVLAESVTGALSQIIQDKV